ncbi:radical SAM protein [Bradyrhizobium sp. 190]|uniref:radical SAM protein n=1 Tax=Bradyrhizobium sp. 190 TaxID=2782658 RepID=UPI001FFBEE7B|nr:radical SAM protein [Bradyrhizobium sp. 190]MCK1516510.1 radical SAM protein [Bradyrhizobium sp. 190]
MLPPIAVASGPSVLGVLLTSKCNISCRHCCNDSHPSRSGAARFEDIARIIETAREIPSIREIGISGGEPFMFVDLLQRVVRFAGELGYTSSITTNGFWGRSQRATRLIRDLQRTGLRAIHISTSVFHQEFLDLGTVIEAANTALLAGLKVAINLVSTSSLSSNELQASLGDLADRVEIIVMPCQPVGRGATEIRSDEFGPKFARPYGNCREHFKKLAVDRRGDVYPCCSPGGFSPPLRMGNVNDASLRSILDSAADSKLLAILEAVGPQFFLPFLRAAAGEADFPDKFNDQCHLCHVMLSSNAYAQTISEAAEQLFSELASLVTVEPPAEPVDRVFKLAAKRRTQAMHLEPHATG